MTIESNTDGANQAADAAKGEVGLTLEQALEKISTLETNFQQAVSGRDKAKLKLRELEEVAGNATTLQKQYDDLFTEKSKLFEQFEGTTAELNSMKEHARNQVIDSALTTALEAAGSKSVSTVMKLIDKAKLQFDEQGNVVADSIASVIKAVQDSDPILFGEAPAAGDDPIPAKSDGPSVKRAAEAAVESAFEKEIKGCKTQQQIEAVLRKYGKMN